MSIPVAGQLSALAGVDSYCLKGKESTYGTKANSIATHFGIVQRVSPTSRNNLIQVRGFKGSTTGGRQMIKTRGGNFECGISVEFQPQTWAWLEDVMGTVSGSGTVGSPYVYIKANTLPSYSIAANVELGSTDQDLIFLGSSVSTCSIKATYGEAASVTIEYLSASVEKENTLQSEVALSSLDIFIFSGVTFEYPDGTTVDHPTESIEITINNNTEIRKGLGSRLGKKAIAKQLEYTIKVTLDKEDDTFVDDFLGGSGDDLTPALNPTRVATIGIKFSNSATHSADFVFTGVTIDEPGGEQTYSEVIQEDISFISESLTVTEIQGA